MSRTLPASRTALLAALLCLLAPSACANRLGDADPLTDAQVAFRTGKYDRAIALFKDLANAGTPASNEARRGLLRALIEVGRYEEAEKTGLGFAGDAARAPHTANLLGEVLVLRGKLLGADSAFALAISASAPDSLTARLNRALVQYHRGQREQALADLDRFIDVYNERRGRLSSDELMAIGTACRYLGTQDPQLFKDALKAFDEAIAADSNNLEASVRLGELFLEKYNGPDAGATFDAVLRVNPSHPRALLGSARRKHFDGASGITDLVKKSLEVNPNLVPARVFLATLALDVEDFELAAKEAERALTVDSSAAEPLSVLAVSRRLRGDSVGFESARRRALARDPRYAGVYVTMAELSARSRFYREAAGFARQATELDAKSWRAYALQGVNQLRIGEIDEGRKSLETAFAGDPYDLWTKNTLDLLDTFKDYREIATPHFRLFIGERESELIGLYLGELAEEAYARFAARYGYQPAGPIRLEVYRSHADFSVRTVGLAGLGALGVSFGPVLAMDSPSARRIGEFNWGSTAWHEIAHTFTLGASGHRVPRWLSEGMSVLEERRGRPGWGADVSPSFLAYYKRGRMLPASKLNDGFMRPRWPAEVMLAYYEASLVCEMIERDWGAAAIGAMLRAYGEGLATPAVVSRVLKIDMPTLDKRFDKYVADKFAGPLAALRVSDADTDEEETSTDSTRPRPPRRPRMPIAMPGAADDTTDWGAQLMRGRALFEEGKKAEAVPYLQRAKALFPEYGGEDSPYGYLAAIYKEQGDARKAADELGRLTTLSESNYQANVEEAALRESFGDRDGAAAALERAMWISPYEIGLHARLASLYSALGQRPKALRERKAVLALRPVDMAEALYQLALAHYEAGDGTSARRTVLQALERAPNFEAAQELLLKVTK